MDGPPRREIATPTPPQPVNHRPSAAGAELDPGSQFPANPISTILASRSLYQEKSKKICGLQPESEGCSPSHLYEGDTNGLNRVSYFRASYRPIPLDGGLKQEYASCFGKRIMCLDASFVEELIVCGDVHGNLLLFSSPSRTPRWVWLDSVLGVKNCLNFYCMSTRRRSIYSLRKRYIFFLALRSSTIFLIMPELISMAATRSKGLQFLVIELCSINSPRLW